MPKIRDLGINVIPETMRPPEIGPGGGGTCLTTSPGNTGYYPQAQVFTGETCLTTSPGQTGHTGYYQQAQALTAQTCLTTSPTNTGYYQQVQTPQTCLTTSPGHDSGHPGCYYGLTREAIQQLKAQLQRQIEQLDEYARNLGPKTPEAIDAREKELRAELEELDRRRKEYKKNE
jgi:hypothetical protein